MSSLVIANYNDSAVTFRDDGWFNATEAASRYDKNPAEWLRLPSTASYVDALERRYGKIPYVKTSKARADRGGGTWLHPKLGVRFAQWLDLDFAVWCDEQIETLIHGSQNDSRRLRHEAASSYKVMNHVLQLTRQGQGKASAPHHYINEAKLINGVLTGEFKGLNRDKLPDDRLALLAALEAYNTVQIAMGNDYAARKDLLFAFAAEWHQKHAPKLPDPQTA